MDVYAEPRCCAAHGHFAAGGQGTGKLEKADAAIPHVWPSPGFHRGDWRKLSVAQHRAMWRQRRIQMQAFFIAFAHANAAEQAAIIAAAKGRFAQRQAHRQANRPGGRGGRGNLASRLPQMMASHLVSGNPQMHAAMAGFFMAMHNTGR